MHFQTLLASLSFSCPAYTDFQFWCVWVFNLPHFEYSDFLLDITPTSLLLDSQDIWKPWSCSHQVWHPCVLVLWFTILTNIFH